MDDWKDTDNDTRYGVVVCAFDGDENHKLKLLIGDAILIHKECQGWYFGCSIRSQNKKGIFPKKFVHVKQASITLSGAVSLVVAKELPIVNEMTAVLREWGKIWKNLYVTHKTTGSPEAKKYKDLRVNILKLIEGRKKIMSRKLTVDELKATQQKYSHIIDIGNAKLGLDLVVRDEDGNTLDPQHTSTINLFKQHEVAAKRVDRMMRGLSSDVERVHSTSFNLWINVKAFVCNVTEMSELYISLYDATENCFLTESYLCKYGEKGLPRDIEMLNNMKALFTDLGAKDLARERVFLICEVIRYGRMSLSEPDNKKDTHNLRRPFGIAACDVTDFIKFNDTLDQPLVAAFYPCGEKENLEGLIRKVVSNKDSNVRDQGLHFKLRKITGDLAQVKKEHANLIAPPTVIVRKLGFPDVIMPDDVRNDLYVTIVQGEFRRGHKSSDKNVEVTMAVCNQHGAVLQGVIYEGVGGEMIDEYKSVIYYHEDKPKWCETVKIGISINDFYGSHLRFTFKHRSSVDVKDKAEKPFALSYVRLMHDNGTVTLDGTHNLLVYKIDQKKWDDKPVYLKVPSKQKEIENKPTIGQMAAPSGKQLQIQSGPFSCNMADGFTIQTLVCSTKLTHNVDLMGLLKWRDNPKQLKQNLLQFMRVDGAEVVKFLPDVLDSLFSIFMENSDSDKYDSAVFAALIYVVGLVSDVKYHQFRSVLDLYIRENYSATLAYNKLIVVLREQLEKYTDTANHSELLKTMNSLPYIFKFINGSRRLFARLNEQRGKQAFETAMKDVFRVMGRLTSQNNSKLVLIQQACLRLLPETLTDIITVFMPLELSSVLMDLLQQIPTTHLVRERINFMYDVVKSDLFKLPDCRRIMLPVMMRQIDALLHRNEQIDLCFNVLSQVMDSLYAESTHEDISTVMNIMLRTLSQTISRLLIPPAPALCVGVAVLTALLRQMTHNHYIEYLSSFETNVDLMDFLMEILMGFNCMIEQGVFPSDWCDMILLKNDVFLKAIQQFSATIRSKFVSPFEFPIWDTFFQCSITFVNQQALALHKFSTAKKNKIIKRYGDMRRETGKEVTTMWYSLEYNKIQFIPHLVGLILEMTLIPEPELRKATLPVFYDMMYCEYSGQAASRTNRHTGFNKFELELISKLDELIGQEGKGDKEYRDLFYSILHELCTSKERMREEGVAMVNTTYDLLLMLLEYHDVINSENIDSQMSCIVGLLNFYDKIGRQELYVVYLHRLCDLHLGSDNFTEAAHTKMLYAKLLQWSDEPVTRSLLNPNEVKTRDVPTQRELKMRTFYQIINNLDKGKMWERGIEFCKELGKEYETQSYDYTALAKILRRQAEFYTHIMESMRPWPNYFRVAYYGKGFPTFLQNREFVYRGRELEKLGEFSGRKQSLFPNASLMRTLNPPTEEMKNSNQQYLQINSVTPVLELKEHLKHKSLNEQIINYYRVNEVDRFFYNKRKRGSDMTEMWLEKTYLTTTEPLPGILRWFPVNSTTVVEVSPLENALETMQQTNEKIQGLIDAFSKSDPSVRVDQLSMVLNGVIDAAVSGGVANYKLFYTNDYLADHPDHVNVVRNLKDTTSLQLLLLHLGLGIHRKNAPESLIPFHEHLETRFKELKASIETDYGIQLTDKDQQQIAKQHNIALKRIMSIKPLQPKSSPSVSGRKFHTSYLRTAQVNSYHRTPSKNANNTQRSQSLLTRPNTTVLPTARPDGKTKVFTRAATTASKGSPRASNASMTSQHGGGDQKPAGSQSPSLQRVTMISESGEDGRIRLSEEITPSRPLRPRSQRPDSRPSSGQYSNPGDLQAGVSMSSINSLGSSSGSISTLDRMSFSESEGPPPLPYKHSTSVVSTASTITNDDKDLTPPVLPSKSGGSQENLFTVSAKDGPAPSLPSKHMSTHGATPPKVAEKPKMRKPTLSPITTDAPPPILPPKHVANTDEPPHLPPRSPYTPKPALEIPAKRDVTKDENSNEDEEPTTPTNENAGFF